MASIFTRIINGEIPCHKIMEDVHHIAFLDLNPVKPGHTLVVPKQEINYIFDMDDAALGALMAFARKVAVPLKKATNPTKVGIMVAGLEVPHVHIHLIPITGVGDLSFKLATKATAEELTAMAAKIKAAI